MEVNIDTWKNDENFHLNRSHETLDSTGIEEQLNESKMEDQFEMEEEEIVTICQFFIETLSNDLEDIYKVSVVLIKSDYSLIETLIQMQFFQTFGNILNEISNEDDRIISLKILLNFSKLPENACVLLIEQSLFFLKNQIFSCSNDIKYLSLKCLNRFAKNSHKCRFFILFQRFLVELYSLIIGYPNDTNAILLIEKIISNLLLEDISDDNINFLRKIAFELIKKGHSIDISCRILHYLSEDDDSITDYILNAPILVHFIDAAKNAKCLRYLMKFFVVRSDIENENGFPEAEAYFSNSLFQIIFDCFFINDEEETDQYNTYEMKVDWSSKLIGVIIENVNESVYQFFEIGFFESYIHFSENGSFTLKSISAYVLSRVLRKVTVNSITLDDTQFDALNNISAIFAELIDPTNTNKIISFLDFFLNLISLQSDPTQVISILSEDDIFENILMIAEQNDSEDLRMKAENLRSIINEHTQE